MAKEQSAKLPTAPLRDLFAWWRAARVQGVIIGGLAVGLQTKPRVTKDVDAVVAVDEAKWPQFLATGRKHSFRSRLPHPLEYARINRIFVMTHRPSKVDVDLAIAGMPFEAEVIQRRQRVKVERLNVPVATPEDLLVFKAVSRRGIDDADVARLLEWYPNFDLDYVRSRVDMFAKILDMSDITEDFDRIVARQRRDQRN